jgi:diacylglycerol kinase (ATP)
MSDDGQLISGFKSRGGMKRIFSAIFYSINGFKCAWKNEHAFRHEIAVAISGLIVALLLPVTKLEKLALIGVLVLVLIIEIVNSAIEALVDRISLEPNELSKNAKDLGSAAVCLAILLAVAVWAVILLPWFAR